MLQIRGFNYAELVNSLSQDRSFGMAGGGDAARGAVGGFLYDVTGVAARPFPADFMRLRGAIQSLPPRKVSLPSKTSVHRLNNIFRICEILTWQG